MKSLPILTLKTSLISVSVNSLFTETLYESETYNSNKDTTDILSDFFQKNAYMNSEPGISNTMFKKEKMNTTKMIGRSHAKVFGGSKLKLKD